MLLPWLRRRTALVASLACAFGACSESTPSGPAAAGGSPPATSAGGGSGGASGNAAAVGTGGGGAGALSGTPGGSAGANGGGGAAPVGGAGGSAGANGGGGAAAGAAGSSGACPAGAIVCDDFEKYQDGATDLSPDWVAYTYSGSVKVDSSKPHSGKQSLHLNTEQGMRHYADIIREQHGQELVPLRHFGRLMVWITAIPPNAHWNISIASGPMSGAPDEIVKFLQGGMFGKLMSNYAQRPAAKAGDQHLLRGGGPEQGDAPADADCAVAAPQQAIAAGRWVCWEWEFDGPNASARLWLDGVPMTEIDAIGHGKQCQGPGFGGRPMSADYAWEGPRVFDKVVVGWEQYQDTAAQEVWIDDVVIGGERILCPPPL